MATKDRIERYLCTQPDGTVVTVEHDIDTGDTKIVVDTKIVAIRPAP